MLDEWVGWVGEVEGSLLPAFDGEVVDAGSSFDMAPKPGVNGLRAPPRTFCHRFEPEGAPGLVDRPALVEGAKWWDVCVAVVGTGAAGVKESLFRSGSSRLFRRRGELPRPDGEAGLEEGVGEMLFWLAGGMGRRRLGCLEEPDLLASEACPLPEPGG